MLHRRAQFVLFGLVFIHPCFPQMTSPSADQGSASMTEQVRLSEILIATPQPYDPVQVAGARNKAEELRDAIRRGGTFADIARANSQGPSAAQGGDLGCFTHGKLSRTLDEIVFQMKAGEVSDVIRTKQGFVILEASDRNEHACDDLQVLNQPLTAELKPYVETLKQKVHEKWFKLMPKSARSPEFRQGSVMIQFSIQRSGAITDAKVASSSGYHDLDEAALTAIRDVSTANPLPSATKGDHLQMRFHFQYNPAKTTGL
jgi:TonB family protein